MSQQPPPGPGYPNNPMYYPGYGYPQQGSSIPPTVPSMYPGGPSSGQPSAQGAYPQGMRGGYGIPQGGMYPQQMQPSQQGMYYPPQMVSQQQPPLQSQQQPQQQQTQQYMHSGPVNLPTQQTSHITHTPLHPSSIQSQPALHQYQPAAAVPASCSYIPQAPPPSTVPPNRHLSYTQYSVDVLNNLGRFNVGDLCTLGRELVSELVFRTAQLCQALKSVSDTDSLACTPQRERAGKSKRFREKLGIRYLLTSYFSILSLACTVYREERGYLAKKLADYSSTCDKKSSGQGDTQFLLDYCQLLMTKLVEVRLRIEKKKRKKKISCEDFIEMCSDPHEETPSKALTDVQDEFALNRAKLISLSSDLKMLDWYAAVSDPSHLKRLDRLKGSDKPINQ